MKIGFLFSLLFGVGTTVLRASSAILDCTGDTWVDARQPEQRHSRDTELHLHGRQKLALLNFHFPVVSGWKIQRATLVLHLNDIQPLKVLGLMAAPVRWNEVEANAVRGADKLPWGAEGTTLPAALGKFDKDKANFVPVKENDLGWVEVDVPLSIVEACASGKAHGIVLFVRTRDGERLIDSRDTVRFAPVLKVEGLLR